MRSKGQSFLPDFVGSLVVFSIILSIFLFSWHSMLSERGEFSVENEMIRNARYTSIFLVSTPGYPSNWTNETVQIVGFASDENIINTTKLKEFGELDQSRMEELLEAGNFYLSFRNGSGVMRLDGSKLEWGSEPSNARTVVPIRRTVLLNYSGNLKSAEMNYVVWR